MLDFNPFKANCTGCAACYSVCPVHCIKMNEDNEGFLYPEASDACIHCGLCEKVCPANKPKQELEIEQTAIAAVSKDYNVWKRSASGGAFSEICRYWANDDTLIVGAAWEGFNVHHIGVRGFDQIAPLCKSKYVSSAVEDTFIEIEETLKEGKKAVFCGCPCQVAGLQSFLRKEYNNLLTIDLICHGQGSPKVFKACIDSMSCYFGSEITQYQFRAKRKWYEIDYLSSITSKSKTLYLTKDPYIQLFLSQNALRPSCGKNCKYRDIRRYGDITIADFKGMSHIFPYLRFSNKNWSTMVANTKKGLECINNITTMDFRPITIDDVIAYNPLFAKQTWFSNDRDSFFEDFKADEEKAINKWTVPATIYKGTIKKTIIAHLPRKTKRILSRCISFLFDR